MSKTLDRRKQILKAAVDVFAERGFHRTRVSDIAKKADVAYGLIYHYFDSKDDVLDSVFRDNWSIFLKVLKDLRDDRSKSVVERLGIVIDSLLEALYVAPAVVQVIIQEVSRSDRFVEKEKYEDQKKKRLETKRKSFIRDRSVDLKSEPNPNLIIKNELNK